MTLDYTGRKSAVKTFFKKILATCVFGPKMRKDCKKFLQNPVVTTIDIREALIVELKRLH